MHYAYNEFSYRRCRMELFRIVGRLSTDIRGSDRLTESCHNNVTKEMRSVGCQVDILAGHSERRDKGAHANTAG
jgi:hypothetical protein